MITLDVEYTPEESRKEKTRIVQFNQFVGGRQTGKTRLLVNRVVDAAIRNENILVWASSRNQTEMLKDCINFELSKYEGTEVSGSFLSNDFIISDVSDYCECCSRGETKVSKITFSNRENRYMHPDTVYSFIAIDNVEMLASDVMTAEENLFSGLRSTKRTPDCRIFVTSARPLNISSELYI